jgi:SAM-dependent methyltransferase
MVDHIFRMIIGGPIFRAPPSGNTRPQRVLDMGCGTGLWTIIFADEWPAGVGIGTDLSPIQPSWVPPNCKFYVDDIEGEWTYPPAEHFDYIHGRTLLWSIAGWKELFSSAFNNLKPGGILEIQDHPPHPSSDDDGLRHVPYLADWLKKMNDGWSKIGKPTRIVRGISLPFCRNRITGSSWPWRLLAATERNNLIGMNMLGSQKLTSLCDVYPNLIRCPLCQKLATTPCMVLLSHQE